MNPVPNTRSSTQTVRTDVLVIGGGAAGIRAALSAADNGASVLLVSNVPAGEGGTSFRNLSGGWGIQAVVGGERTEAALEAFYDDIIRVGLGVADPTLVHILVEESGPCFEDLLEMGVRFRRLEQGGFFRTRGCFSAFERAFITESLENVRKVFLSAIRRSTVKTLTGEALRLLVADGRCWGSWILDESGGLIRAVSPATILATGGGAGIFPISLVSETQVGAGCALALEAGAELRNMEFIQFMLVLQRRGETAFLPLLELARKGCLKTEDGQDVLEKHIPDARIRASSVEDRQGHYPFSTRDRSFLVDLAVARENAHGRTVFRHEGQGETSSWTVSHAAHAYNGGIRIDERAESTLPGLFAAGETAAGPHGADRIGGCMMTATQVFGRRAGQYAAQQALLTKKVPDRLPDYSLLEQSRRSPSGPENLVEAESLARSCFQAFLGVIRHAQGLRLCLAEVHKLRDEVQRMTWRDPATLKRLHRLSCALAVGEAVSSAALARKYSLGSSMRLDQPNEQPL